ncbi:hypothetical protein DPMN_056403 [Dreissena polymorpha]|uniref:Uncharacterized protein n=1 Tax=Dreissena polymorpha TaxID=45954 RepID=A0A9D4CTK6_DREPO|nr:hypothetical protein DPMN_056403 [Dreissena polymorpha]
MYLMEYGPDYTLTVTLGNQGDHNTQERLQSLYSLILSASHELDPYSRNRIPYFLLPTICYLTVPSADIEDV